MEILYKCEHCGDTFLTPQEVTLHEKICFLHEHAEANIQRLREEFSTDLFENTWLAHEPEYSYELNPFEVISLDPSDVPYEDIKVFTIVEQLTDVVRTTVYSRQPSQEEA